MTPGWGRARCGMGVCLGKGVRVPRGSHIAGRLTTYSVTAVANRLVSAVPCSCRGRGAAAWQRVRQPPCSSRYFGADLFPQGVTACVPSPHSMLSIFRLFFSTGRENAAVQFETEYFWLYLDPFVVGPALFDGKPVRRNIDAGTVSVSTRRSVLILPTVHRRTTGNEVPRRLPR